MTAETRWHRHWYVTVKEDGRIYRWLRKPRWFAYDTEKVEKSKFAWGYVNNVVPPMYYLSILGLLHGLTGLTLYWDDEE